RGRSGCRRSPAPSVGGRGSWVPGLDYREGWHVAQLAGEANRLTGAAGSPDFKRARLQLRPLFGARGIAPTGTPFALPATVLRRPGTAFVLILLVVGACSKTLDGDKFRSGGGSDASVGGSADAPPSGDAGIEPRCGDGTCAGESVCDCEADCGAPSC